MGEDAGFLCLGVVDKLGSGSDDALLVGFVDQSGDQWSCR